MDLNEFNTRTKVLERQSYTVIRRKINDFSDESNNDEIAGFVKGVVALQAELYMDYEREFRQSENKE